MEPSASGQSYRLPCQPRPTDLTYGGLAPRRGFERDHRVPLCLGGLDTRENVWYEPWPEYAEKNEVERHVCVALCHGSRLDIDEMRKDFETGNWRKWK